MLSLSVSVVFTQRVRFSKVLFAADVLDVFRTIEFVVGAEFAGRMIRE